MKSTVRETETVTGGERDHTHPEETEEEHSPPERDEIFEVLSNRRRQYVLAALERDDEHEKDFSDLVTEVAALENEIPVNQVDSNQRKSVYVGLRQTHLPKMAEYNLLEYDRNRGRVELGDAAETAEMYLEYVPEKDIPWAYHYLGLSVLMGLITGVSWLDVYPFGGLDGLTLAWILVATVAVSAVAHTHYTHRNRLDRMAELNPEE